MGESYDASGVEEMSGGMGQDGEKERA